MSKDEDVSSITSHLSTLKMSTQIEQECEGLLKAKGVKVGCPIMPPKKGGHEGDMELITNVYPLYMNTKPMTVFRYDVKIEGLRLNGRKLDFTRKFRDDATNAERRFRCRDIVIAFMNREAEIAESCKCMYHDLQSIMFTLQEMKLKESPIVFHPAELGVEFGVYNLEKVHMFITPVANEFRLTVGDLSNISSDLLYANRELAQFLDIATSQEIFFRPGEHVHFSTGQSYLYDPLQHDFTQGDTVSFEENRSYLAVGCQKSIHLVEGPPSSQTGRSPAVVVECKKTPFHEDVLLSAKVLAIIGHQGLQQMNTAAIAQKLDKNLKGLVVETVHRENIFRFTIKKISAENAGMQIIMPGSAGQSTIAQYFQDKYHIKLEHPKLPLIVTDGAFADSQGKKQKVFYPIEVLKVCDNQRVKTQQLTPNMTSQAIRKCAIPPFTLRNQIKLTANSIHLFDSNYLNVANMGVLDSPLITRAHNLKNPSIQFGDGETRPDENRGATWRGNRFFAPQSVIGGDNGYAWAAFVFWPSRCRDRSLNQKDFHAFVERYENQQRKRGLVLPPAIKKMVVTMQSYDEMAEHFKWANQNGVAFMLCIHGETDDDTHHEIKANERRYYVITQCVKSNTVWNVVNKNQGLTVDNIGNKTNVKLGGINFNLPQSGIANDKTTLVIGITTNHPAGGFGESFGEEEMHNPNRPSTLGESGSISSLVEGPPSVIGYAANVGPTKLPFDFVGDFLFQKSRREEKVNLIEVIVQRCVEYFKMVRDGCVPERTIVYRNGASEGQYLNILKYEIPLLRKALADLTGKDAGLTYIVPNKMQSVRFFRMNINQRAKPADQNIGPGTVVDTTVVHPVFCEFYLNSHCALQGTTRTPKYTLLYDNNDYSIDQLERITYDLCFGHQIVFMPISLPAPCRIAFEYAKRGRNLYNQLSEELRRQNQDLTYDLLNKSITFHEADWISAYRVNA